MFQRVLVANRGEIALRIIRCLREMEIESVLIYSEADKESLPVKIATIPVCIGPANAKESYLNQDLILDIALKTGCEAIHPGYGFLSENAEFAAKCEEKGISFIGPCAEIIRRMGDKMEARKLMMEHNVPVVPGSKEVCESLAGAKELADKIGYPVLLKAVAGGGGRGMRRVYAPEEFEQAYQSASMEAKAAFGNGDMYLEKLILNPHHIEFQILADKSGNTIYLGERDCSIQRRNQKMIEESPSKILDKQMRAKMGEVAVRAAKAAGYYSAGTIEFVVDEEGNYYFIEMNTRIQVEHPVTEMVTGIDLVREQIKIAAGMDLSVKQEDIVMNGHAIECRINAENPKMNFMPSPGKIDFLHFPGGKGVRVESAIYDGYEVSPFYDSMIAKIIVHADNRLEAIRKMRCALEEMIVGGIETNDKFQYLILFHPEFIRGRYDTGFIERNLEELLEWGKDYE
ncbi:MAG: acetyl-CoA carboxylase biotin carboxylase subunit [Lachnospiraceae bacterium]|nr:acetyl-CoA carboxylase biotin carboxylase subunit [Lachnospiraceae bacterium]